MLDPAVVTFDQAKLLSKSGECICVYNPDSGDVFNLVEYINPYNEDSDDYWLGLEYIWMKSRQNSP